MLFMHLLLVGCTNSQGFCKISHDKSTDVTNLYFIKTDGDYSDRDALRIKDAASLCNDKPTLLILSNKYHPNNRFEIPVIDFSDVTADFLTSHASKYVWLRKTSSDRIYYGPGSNVYRFANDAVPAKQIGDKICIHNLFVREFTVGLVTKKKFKSLMFVKIDNQWVQLTEPLWQLEAATELRIEKFNSDDLDFFKSEEFNSLTPNCREIALRITKEEYLKLDCELIMCPIVRIEISR